MAQLLISAFFLVAVFAALSLGATCTVSWNASGAFSGVGAITATDNAVVEAVPTSVPAAQPATLTARANNAAGTLTMTNSNHGIVTGQRLDLYWPNPLSPSLPGQTFNVTAGTVSGTTVPITCNTTGLSAPAATGLLSQVAGGTIAATTYFVKITYVNANGETLGGTEASLAVSLNNLLVVASPPQSGAGSLAATGYNVYVSTTTGTETKQNGSTPIPIGVSWTEPTTGLVAGAALPSANTTGSNLPVVNSPINVGIPQQVTFAVTGSNMQALICNSTQQSFFVFDVGTVDDLALYCAANQGYEWINGGTGVNPLAGFVTTSVWISHGFTGGALQGMQAGALTH